MKKNIILITFMCIFVLNFIMTPMVYGKYTTTVNKSVTINVRKPEYTVVFHSNDGNDNTVSQSYVYGTSQPLTANSFSYTNHFFKRWNTLADGSGTSYSNMQSVSNLNNQDGGVVDLYAQWAPDFSITGNVTSWTNQDVTLTVVLVSGSYSDYEYSFDNGVTWSSNYSHAFSSNQDVYVKIRDSIDYVSAAKLESITKIDKVPPVITYNTDIEYNNDHSTSQVTTLIVTLDENVNVLTGVNVSDDVSGVASGWPKCYRGGNQITSTNIFTNVGRYAIYCKAQDNAGNETTENREVLVRWPLSGKYVVKKTILDGAGIAGTGLSSTTSPNGLYLDNASTGANVGLPFASKYYYTGPTVDNYISFAGSTFRILNIATKDSIKVLGDVSDVKTGWGNRKIYDSNTFNTWSTKWWPRGQIYNNETGESKYKVFTDTEKAHLDLATFYAGRFNKSDAVDISYTVYYEQTGGVNLGGSNDTNPAFEGYSAYPNVSDYLKACKAHDYITNIDDTQDTTILGIGTDKRQIFNDNNWIDMSVDQWTMNSKNATSTDNDFWVVDATLRGRIISRTYYYNQQYRVVFYINDTTILSGSGSSGDPYTVQEDWAWFDSYQVVQ